MSEWKKCVKCIYYEMLFSLKKMNSLPFVTTQMSLKDIMLRGKERQILYDLTFMWNLKKTELIEVENNIVIARGEVWGLGEMDENGQKMQTSRYKINKFWECNVLHGDYSQQCSIVYLKVARRKVLTTRKKL